MVYQAVHQFDKGRVFHLMEPDVNQELYGVPQYLSALQSAWLNEAATLFRRKYYKNGSHAGFVFYMTDAAANTQDVDNLLICDGVTTVERLATQCHAAPSARRRQPADQHRAGATVALAAAFLGALEQT